MWAALGVLTLGSGQAPASQSPAPALRELTLREPILREPIPPAPILRAPARQTGGTPTRGGGPVAVAAREVNLRETGHLHSVGEPGNTIVEQGRATGTFNCVIAVHLTIVSSNRVIAAFTVKPHGGSVTGTGSARFTRQSANGYFGGTIAISNGTGSYTRASGSNIGISGVISSETLALTVHVHGKIHL